ncbi:hypothetical protein BU16DRAFT_618601 [Lophium mytilinum]|uniref:Uncharacterized protein n=1 Tax=Lophium mytilinum TaxID=390894 RepID=A0A6A6QPX1_9PEZI|nr:hypothetical protein BU16DRAFT_618601 [Lophium mytilinum]
MALLFAPLLCRRQQLDDLHANTRSPVLDAGPPAQMQRRRSSTDALHSTLRRCSLCAPREVPASITRRRPPAAGPKRPRPRISLSLTGRLPMRLGRRSPTLPTALPLTHADCTMEHSLAGDAIDRRLLPSRGSIQGPQPPANRHRAAAAPLNMPVPLLSGTWCWFGPVRRWCIRVHVDLYPEEAVNLDVNLHAACRSTAYPGEASGYMQHWEPNDGAVPRAFSPCRAELAVALSEDGQWFRAATMPVSTSAELDTIDAEDVPASWIHRITRRWK